MQDIILLLQHHPALSFALITLVVIAACIEYMRLRQQAGQLSPTAAVLLINREKAAVVDIRTKNAFMDGHITDAMSIPLADLPQHSDKLTSKCRSRPVIIVCATGADSAKAALSLQQKGLDSRILAGGMQAWITAGLPLIRN